MRQLQVDARGTDWDRELATLGGHPWQSAHWAEAERTAHGTDSFRLWLRENGETIQMARVEQRSIRGMAKLAWIRRGPTNAERISASSTGLEPELRRYLVGQGYCIAVASPWQVADDASTLARDKNLPRTLWIDLSQGRDQLWASRSTAWRTAVRRAARGGVVVETSEDPHLVAELMNMCAQLSQAKGFDLRASAELTRELLRAPPSNDAEAKLFVAMCKGRLAAGALVARCGPSINCMWGTSNRAFSRDRPGDALHWAIMEWGIGKGCTRYDMEGIDPKGNPGVYAFKKRIGGTETALLGWQVMPLNVSGRLLAPVLNRILNPTDGLQARVHERLASLARGA